MSVNTSVKAQTSLAPLSTVFVVHALLLWNAHSKCCIYQTVLCPSPGLSNPKSSVITSESEVQSHHLKHPESCTSRVRVKKKIWVPSHESSSPHIQHLFIFQNMKTNNKNVSNIRVKQRNTARPATAWTRARVTISESESDVKVKKNWTAQSRVPTRVTQHWFQSYAKTLPSRMKLTMKLTMREPTFMGSMTNGHVITACDVWL